MAIGSSQQEENGGVEMSRCLHDYSYAWIKRMDTATAPYAIQMGSLSVLNCSGIINVGICGGRHKAYPSQSGPFGTNQHMSKFTPL